MSSSDTTEAGAARGATPRSSWQPVLLGVGAVLSLLLVAVGGLGLSGIFGSSPAGRPANPDAGARLAAFSPALQRVGARGSLVAPWSHARPGVLLFFARWCGQCHLELPALASAIGSGHLEGVAVLGIDEDTPAVARSFVRGEGLHFPVGIDQGEALAARLVPAGLPSTVFVNARGRVVGVHYGSLSPAQLRNQISALLLR